SCDHCRLELSGVWTEHSRWPSRCRYFCFQAEDGIRDSSVTGVQTCALPISADHHRMAAGGHSVMIGSLFAGTEESPGEAVLLERSEERRVGKECRSRRWRVPEKGEAQCVDAASMVRRSGCDVRVLCGARWYD